MARFLSWKHLSRDQLVALRGAQAAPSTRDVLRECLGTSTSSAVEAEAEEQQQRQDIILDLFSYTLKQGQVGASKQPGVVRRSLLPGMSQH